MELAIPTKVRWIFRSKIPHDSAAKYATYSGAKFSIRDKEGRRVGYKAIDNVILKPNTITKLSGKLFSDVTTR